MFNVICIKNRIEMVRVPVYNVQIDIPSESDIVYVTVDENESIWGWSQLPTISLDISAWDSASSRGLYLGTLAFSGDWKESLYEISDHFQDLLKSK